jgi:hypothetical protein
MQRAAASASYLIRPSVAAAKTWSRERPVSSRAFEATQTSTELITTPFQKVGHSTYLSQLARNIRSPTSARGTDPSLESPLQLETAAATTAPTIERQRHARISPLICILQSPFKGHRKST